MNTNSALTGSSLRSPVRVSLTTTASSRSVALELDDLVMGHDLDAVVVLDLVDR